MSKIVYLLLLATFVAVITARPDDAKPTDASKDAKAAAADAAAAGKDAAKDAAKDAKGASGKSGDMMKDMQKTFTDFMGIGKDAMGMFGF